MTSCTRTPECPRRRRADDVLADLAGQFAMFPDSYEYRLRTSPPAGEVVLTERVDMIADFDGSLHGVPVMGTFVVDGGKIYRWTRLLRYRPDRQDARRGGLHRPPFRNRGISRSSEDAAIGFTHSWQVNWKTLPRYWPGYAIRAASARPLVRSARFGRRRAR